MDASSTGSIERRTDGAGLPDEESGDEDDDEDDISRLCSGSPLAQLKKVAAWSGRLRDLLMMMGGDEAMKSKRPEDQTRCALVASRG